MALSCNRTYAIYRLAFTYPVLNFRCFRTRRWVKEKVYLMLNRSNALSFISVSLNTIIYQNHKNLQSINFHTNRGGQPYLTHGTIRNAAFQNIFLWAKIVAFGFQFLLCYFGLNIGGVKPSFRTFNGCSRASLGSVHFHWNSSLP